MSIGVSHKVERLTERSRALMLSEYDMIPCGPKGGKWTGLVRELGRKWGVSISYINKALRRRNKDNEDS
jgi:hypothetical protein